MISEHTAPFLSHNYYVFSHQYYDGLPTEGSAMGQAFRDTEWEEKILQVRYS
jgi:hypothetical protein